MVKLKLTTEQAALLVNIIDAAQFNGNVAQVDEVFAAIQQILDIKAMLLAPEEEN